MEGSFSTQRGPGPKVKNAVLVSADLSQCRTAVIYPTAYNLASVSHICDAKNKILFSRSAQTYEMAFPTAVTMTEDTKGPCYKALWGSSSHAYSERWVWGGQYLLGVTSVTYTSTRVLRVSPSKPSAAISLKSVMNKRLFSQMLNPGHTFRRKYRGHIQHS